MMTVCHAPWENFPDVLLHAAETAIKHDAVYAAAKSGDANAASDLVRRSVNFQAMQRLAQMVAGRTAVFASVHAEEANGRNAIPEALAVGLAEALGGSVDRDIVQANVVAHTGADGFTRLARQASFAGDVEKGRCYVLVDDFIGQGGTLANLRGHVEAQGGAVIAATVLTGKPFSAKIALDTEMLDLLRSNHASLEPWWKERFGFGFDCLTQSEARYLVKSADADSIRNRILAAA